MSTRMRRSRRAGRAMVMRNPPPAGPASRSLPPCGGGLGRGVIVGRLIRTPTPDPSPQGGGEPHAVLSSRGSPSHLEVLRVAALDLFGALFNALGIFFHQFDVG